MESWGRQMTSTDVAMRALRSLTSPKRLPAMRPHAVGTRTPIESTINAAALPEHTNGQ